MIYYNSFSGQVMSQIVMAGGTSGFKKSLLRKMRYLEYEWHCSDTIKALDNRNDKWPRHFSVVILFL
jgi:hypothetical protein